jgi:hypothetical protein
MAPRWAAVLSGPIHRLAENLEFIELFAVVFTAKVRGGSKSRRGGVGRSGGISRAPNRITSILFIYF